MDEGWGWLWVIIIGIAVYYLFFSGPSKVDQLRAALDEANGRIEYLNQEIADAKDNAWSDYYTMGYALSGLETYSEVSDPTKK